MIIGTIFSLLLRMIKRPIVVVIYIQIMKVIKTPYDFTDESFSCEM